MKNQGKVKRGTKLRVVIRLTTFSFSVALLLAVTNVLRTMFLLESIELKDELTVTVPVDVKKLSHCIANRQTSEELFRQRDMMSSNAKRSTSKNQDKFLFYEPQYGTNNQVFAATQAYIWAVVLGRRLVVPPMFTPRVTSFTNLRTDIGTSYDRSSWVDFLEFFRFKESTDLAKLLGKSFQMPEVETANKNLNLEPISFEEFEALGIKPWRILRATRPGYFDNVTHIVLETLMGANETEIERQSVDLRDAFKDVLTGEQIQQHVGGCDDQVLAFEGMFYNMLKGVDVQVRSKDLLEISPRVNQTLTRVHDELTQYLGSSEYACYHVRNGDYKDTCAQVDDPDARAKYPNLPAFYLKYQERNLCLVQGPDLAVELVRDKLPALVLSDNPAIIENTLDFYKGRSATSTWVNKAVEGATANFQAKERNLLSLIVDQELCAAADVAVLSAFSTVSKRKILRGTKQSRSWVRVTPEYRTMVNLLEQQATSDRLVVVTAATYEDRSLLMNLKCNLETVGMQSNLVIAALDRAMYDWGAAHGLPVFVVDEMQTAGNAWNRSEVPPVANIRPEIILQILEVGYSVLWTDLDNIWFQNPMDAFAEYLTPEFQSIAIQSDAPYLAHPEQDNIKPHPSLRFPVTHQNAASNLSSGLYLAKSAPLVIDAFRRIAERAKENNSTEQDSFNSILCAPPPSLDYVSSYCAYRHGNRTMNVSVLDRFAFANGAVLVGEQNRNVFDTGKDVFQRETKKELVVARNDWIIGSASKKQRGVDLGAWFYDLESEGNGDQSYKCSGHSVSLLAPQGYQDEDGGFRTCKNDTSLLYSSKLGGHRKLKQGQWCAGSKYDELTYKIHEHLEAHRPSNPSFGHRPFPLPENVTILVMGNSHTRQMINALVCQYADKIVDFDSLVAFGTPRSDAYRARFENNSTLITLTNSPIVYSRSWPILFAAAIGLNIKNLDGIVMGSSNGYRESQKTSLTETVADLSSFVGPDAQIDLEGISPPTLMDVAREYDGPIVYVSMFGVQGDGRKKQAIRHMLELQANRQRNNIDVIDGRQYINLLGMECASENHHEVQDCDETSPRPTNTSQRCSGEKGGHPDLIAWEVIEAVHSLVKQPQQPPWQQQQQQQQQHAFSSSKYKKKDSDSIQRLSKVFPPAEPKISLTHAGLSSGLDCGDSPRGVDGIQIHVLGWRRVKGIQRLLTQLQIADYKGWTMDIPLYVHLDGESSDEVQEIVKAFNWTHGPKMEDFRTENVGLREMWITSIGAAAKEAGVNTLMVIFEDDIVVSPAYFQWLLAMVDRYARNPGCRDTNLVGFSLSPLAYQEMYLPFHPWDADIAVQERYNSTKEYNSPRVPAYLSAVPSSWGAAYWTDRWMDFDRFVRPRMQPPFFDEAADNVTVRPYSDRKMSPKYLHIPGGYFNFWTKSWKRFMIDIMYVRGWVMMYPNLIDHKGLASSAQDDGIHGSNSTNNRFGADLLDAFELEKEGTLPPYDRLAIFGLDFQPRSKELLLAIGKNFLDNVTNHCTNSSCHKLLEVWDANPGSQHPPVPGSPGSPGSPGIPLTCVADVYTSAGAYHDKPVSMASLSSSSSTGRWLVFDPDTTDKSRLEQAASWAKALNRTLLLPPSMPGGVLGINASVSFFGSLPSDADARPWRNLIVGKQSSATTSSWLDGSSTSALHSVDVRHLFGEVSMSLSVLQHYFGGCSDTMLAFRGAW